MPCLVRTEVVRRTGGDDEHRYPRGGRFPLAADRPGVRLYGIDQAGRFGEGEELTQGVCVAALDRLQRPVEDGNAGTGAGRVRGDGRRDRWQRRSRSGSRSRSRSDSRRLRQATSRSGGTRGQVEGRGRSRCWTFVVSGRRQAHQQDGDYSGQHREAGAGQQDSGGRRQSSHGRGCADRGPDGHHERREAPAAPRRLLLSRFPRRQFPPVRELQLGEHVGDVVLDGVRAHAEPDGDLGVGEPFPHVLQHTLLGGRQQIFVRWAPARPAGGASRHGTRLHRGRCDLPYPPPLWVIAIRWVV